MSTSAPFQFAPQAVAEEVTEIKRSALGTALKFCRRQPVGTLGMVMVLIIAVTGLGAEWIAPYNPTSNDFAAMTEAPSWTHLLGTDQLGRDIFSRIVFGARTALIVGFSSAIVGGFAGLVLGVASAYFGGRIDLIMQRVHGHPDGVSADHHGAGDRVDLRHRRAQRDRRQSPSR